jgi:glycosyltransferase involved in cell wall biosynthesis
MQEPSVRIAIDARELAGKPTGVGTFLREVLAAWGRSGETARHELIMCAPPGGGHAGTRWEQTELPGLVRDAQADVLLAPGYTAPLRCPVPTVPVIHDVSFAAHPEWFSWQEGARRRTVTRLAAARAARIVTVSEFSKREIAAYLGVDPGRVRVIYHGVTPMAPAFSAPTPGQRSENVLYVGSIFNRRHIPELIDAFSRIAGAHPDARLDIVGDNRTSPRLDLEAQAARSGAGPRIHLHAYVSDAELAQLYARAGVLVFLSDYEGFGLTPLEALGAGVPIVVLDTAVSREIYGDAAIYAPSPDPAVVAAAVTRALYDDDARGQVRAAAARLLPRYSWDRSAHRLLEVLTEAAG